MSKRQLVVMAALVVGVVVVVMQGLGGGGPEPSGALPIIDARPALEAPPSPGPGGHDTSPAATPSGMPTEAIVAVTLQRDAVPEPDAGETLLVVRTPGSCSADAKLSFQLVPPAATAAERRARTRSEEIHGATTVLRRLAAGPSQWALERDDITILRGSIELAAGVNELEFPCDALPSIRVRVVDSEGRPLPDATVTLAQGISPRAATGSTDGGGLVVFDALPVHPVYQVTATATGYARAHRRDLVFCPGEVTLEVVVELPTERILAGRVLGTTGEPYVGAAVRLGFGRTKRETRTDTQGSFSFDGLPDAPTTVSARVGGLPVAVAHLETLPPDGEEIELRLETGWYLAGRALYEDGTPYTGTGLSARPETPWPQVGQVGLNTTESIEPDETGAFFAGPFPTGSVAVSELFSPGFLVHLVEGQQPVLVIPRRHVYRLEVIVTDASGRPVRERMTQCVTGDNWRLGPVKATPDEDGRIRISAKCSVSEVDVVISADGYVPTTIASGPLDSEQPTQLVATLHTATPFQLHLIDDTDGTAIPDAVATLTWNRDDGSQLLIGWHTPDGRRGDLVGSHGTGVLVVDLWGRTEVEYTVAAGGFYPASGRLLPTSERSQLIRLFPCAALD